MMSRLPLLGAHLSISGGIPRAIERANELGINALQIFVKNSNQWRGRPLLDEEVDEFRKAWDRSKIETIAAHGSYLINLASPSDDLWHRSICAIVEELRRSEILGLHYLVVHPGSHIGTGEKTGVRRIAQAIDMIHDEVVNYNVKIALETTAGQGSSVGYKLQHLRDILAAVSAPERVCVCLDTCHLFAAGYDIGNRTGYERTMELLEKMIGADKVAILHLNDSKKGLGSLIDRHEHIGQGEIGLEGFRLIMNDGRFVQVPKILETPKGQDSRADSDNLDILKRLVLIQDAVGNE